MYSKIFLFLLLMTQTIIVKAGNIELGCQELADNIVNRLQQENLLVTSTASEQRARKISIEACEGNQQSIQQQHEDGIQNALKNWLTQPTGGKAGNKRLKNLKR